MMVWVWLALLLCCSGVVSASETALFGLNRRMLHDFGHSRRPLHRRVFALMKDPQPVLMTVLISNTAINVAIFTISFIALRQVNDAGPAVAVGGIGTLVAVIVLGEILPKTAALAGAERLAPSAAAVVTLLSTALAPLRVVLRALVVTPIIRLLTLPEKTGSITIDELKQLVAHSARDGVIDSREHEMLQAIVAAAHTSVRTIMTPRVDMAAVRVGTVGAAGLGSAPGSFPRRLVVYGRDMDDIRGVVSGRELLLNSDVAAEDLIRPADFIPEQATVMALLAQFRRSGSDFAVVVDEYGGTAGYVSIAHILKWMLGSGETDEAEFHAAERIDDNTYLIPGNLSARLWADRLAMRRLDRRVDTVGGLVLATLGRIPREGDFIRIKNLKLTVERMKRGRIERIRVQRMTDAQAAGTAAQ